MPSPGAAESCAGLPQALWAQLSLSPTCPRGCPRHRGSVAVQVFHQWWWQRAKHSFFLVSSGCSPAHRCSRVQGKSLGLSIPAQTKCPGCASPGHPCHARGCSRKGIASKLVQDGTTAQISLGKGSGELSTPREKAFSTQFCSSIRRAQPWGIIAQKHQTSS